MNRRDRRALVKQQLSHIQQFPPNLTPVPREEWPTMPVMPMQIWRSRKYLAQLYKEEVSDFPGLMRLSVCRAKLGTDGRWEDSLTWDELQAIKTELGFWEWYGIEVYPRDIDVVNVANFRHLWLLPYPINIGWFPGG